MERNIYLISYIIFNEDIKKTAFGNMCSEIVIKNTNILNEIIEEIRAKAGTEGKVWITNIVKLNYDNKWI